MTFGIILIVLAIILVFIMIKGSKENAKDWKKLNEQGIFQANLISFETYAGGHPDLDNTLKNTVIYKTGKDLKIAEQIAPSAPIKNKCSISIDAIKNINIEDSTSIDKKITLGRILLVGVFALAWRKKRKNEMAFVSIEWNDSKFDHSTIFYFEGKNAMQKANTARNKLIKIVR